MSPVRAILYIIWFSAGKLGFIVKTTPKCVKAFDGWNRLLEQSFSKAGTYGEARFCPYL
jgi:hypothetical protein